MGKGCLAEQEGPARMQAAVHEQDAVVSAN